MAEGSARITAATPGAAGARHALFLAWRQSPITNPHKFCITKSFDGDGNRIGWLIRKGGEKGEVLHSYSNRTDAELRDCILTWALLRADPPEGCIERDELETLYALGPQHLQRRLSDLDANGIPIRPGLAGCLAKGWVWGKPPSYNPTYAWFRLTEEGERIASKFFPQGFRTWL